MARRQESPYPSLGSRMVWTVTLELRTKSRFGFRLGQITDNARSYHIFRSTTDNFNKHLLVFQCSSDRALAISAFVCVPVLLRSGSGKQCRSLQMNVQIEFTRSLKTSAIAEMTRVTGIQDLVLRFEVEILKFEGRTSASYLFGGQSLSL